MCGVSGGACGVTESLISDTFLPLTKTDDAPDPIIIPPAES
jgi:hypothetical protein